MNSLSSWFLTKLAPEDVRKDIAFEDIQGALQNQEVQRRWFESMLAKIQQMNAELDNLLASEDRQVKWERIAVERRTLLRALTMIQDAKDSIESERFEQEAQSRAFARYAPLKSGG